MLERIEALYRAYARGKITRQELEEELDYLTLFQQLFDDLND